MVPTVTAFYAALAGLLLIVLSARVIRIRRARDVGIGDGGSPALRRAMRVQANFTEYAPLTLLLIAFIELQGVPAWNVHLLCLVLLAGRAIHAVGVSREPEWIRFRIVGMVLTFLALGAAALENLGLTAGRLAF